MLYRPISAIVKNKELADAGSLSVRVRMLSCDRLLIILKIRDRVEQIINTFFNILFRAPLFCGVSESAFPDSDKGILQATLSV
jgi:hypothetical protein